MKGGRRVKLSVGDIQDGQVRQQRSKELIASCSQVSATEHHKLTASPDMPTFLVYHVTSDTRPSPFSACNIEKVGVAWGRG